MYTKELVLFNFTMDSKHPLLSHQPDIARQLTNHFDQVTVITNDGSSFIDGNLQVLSINWKEGAVFTNLIRFYITALPIMFKKRNRSVVFSHMTDLQSFLISPVTRLFGTPHFLWYAHTHKSIYLKFANFFVNGIVTSTKGSCPIKSEKVVAIGQAIDEELFKPSSIKLNDNLSRGLHVGRLDPSKNLDLIFSEIETLRKNFPHLSITQIGSPSTGFAKLECDSLRIKWQVGIADGWISLKESVSREELPVLFRDFDVFFHTYIGSLDKSLIEATMSGLPVVTINPEYVSEFGSWGKDHKITLSSEYRSILSMSPVNFSEEVRRRCKIAQDRHSKTRWINSLVNVLMSEELTNGRGDE